MLEGAQGTPWGTEAPSSGLSLRPRASQGFLPLPHLTPVQMGAPATVTAITEACV